MRPGEPSAVNQVQLYYPRCPKCGGLTELARTEPSDEPDHDMQMFECMACDHAITSRS